ncbi:MAG: RsmE family RNA methyltransferase [Anaerolineaceae bacterium]
MPHVPRLYLPGHVALGPLVLDANAAHRLGAVMRLRVGDPFFVFSGDGREWSATVFSIEKNRLHATVGEVTRIFAPSPLIIECWCAVVRPNRFDWAIEKCTEAGVDIFRPLVTEHSARGETPSATREERWERLAVEATEQSGRLAVPVIAPAARFDQLLEQPAGPVIVFDRDGRPWQETIALIPEMGRIAIAVGPEGGLSETEISAAKARGALVVSLGPNILRTETAAVAGVVLLRSLGR